MHVGTWILLSYDDGRVTELHARRHTDPVSYDDGLVTYRVACTSAHGSCLAMMMDGLHTELHARWHMDPAELSL